MALGTPLPIKGWEGALSIGALPLCAGGGRQERSREVWGLEEGHRAAFSMVTGHAYASLCNDAKHGGVRGKPRGKKKKKDGPTSHSSESGLTSALVLSVQRPREKDLGLYGVAGAY